MIESIIGYVARETESSFKETWTKERKETFLISQNIEKPLSVDTVVWSAILPDSKVKIGWRGNTWSQLPELRQYLKDHQVSSKHWIIGITQIVDQETMKRIGIGYLPVEPITIDKNWHFLGYDVADETLLSGLMNSGYSRAEDEHRLLEEQFGTILNENHLFDDPQSANDFATWCYEREPAHGTFYVYGLYLIENKMVDHVQIKKNSAGNFLWRDNRFIFRIWTLLQRHLAWGSRFADTRRH